MLTVLDILEVEDGVERDKVQRVVAAVKVAKVRREWTGALRYRCGIVYRRHRCGVILPIAGIFIYFLMRG